MLKTIDKQELYNSYSSAFKRVFRTSLNEYWDRFTGFNIYQFIEDVQPDFAESIYEAVDRLYGTGASDLVKRLEGK